MSIEEIIRAWKADEEALEPQLQPNPVGRELSEQELLRTYGGLTPVPTAGTACDGVTCQIGVTCRISL